MESVYIETSVVSYLVAASGAHAGAAVACLDERLVAAAPSIF
jgi:hypothetical protein